MTKSKYSLNVTSSTARNIVGWGQRNGLFFGLVALVIWFTLSSPHFLTHSNISVILSQVATTGIVAVPAAMLLMAGYVDLSVGSVACLTAIAFGSFHTSHHIGIVPAVLLAMLVAVTCGLISGFLIASMKFSRIVVTLGGLAGWRGVAEFWSKANTTYGFGPGFDRLGNGRFLGLTYPFWICVAAFVIGSYVWYRAPFGRYMLAIGVAREAARSAGINIERIPFLLYIASAAAAGLAGLIYASELDAATLDIGQGFELLVLTAVLLGGVSFMGGYGSLFGVLVGVLFIGVLDDGLIVINISPYVKDIATGVALVVAAGFDVLYRHLDQINISEPDDDLAISQSGGVA